MIYADVDTLKHALRLGDTDDDTSLQRTLDAATRWIDQRCGRRFWFDR